MAMKGECTVSARLRCGPGDVSSFDRHVLRTYWVPGAVGFIPSILLPSRSAPTLPPVWLGQQAHGPLRTKVGPAPAPLSASLVSPASGPQILPQEEDYGFDIEEKNKAVVVKSVQRGSLAEVRPLRGRVSLQFP